MQLCLDMRTGAGCGTENPNHAHLCSKCGKALRFALTLHDPETLVGRYRIVRVIGYGAYGAVYEAHKRNARPVALKETFDASSISTFEREFSVLSGLQHPNLPRYIDIFSEEGNGYLVMEYVAGQSLQEILDEQRELLPESQVLGYALQLCDVLEYLHSQQPPILHRDIKPANIRLTPEGRIKLVDFCLLKQGGYQTRATIRGLGTPAYAPMEQYGDNQQVTDVRSDIYSLASTLYHLLSREEPPSAPNRFTGEHDPLPPLPPEVSLNVRQAVMKAMSLMPRDRFASISHFRQALLGVQSVEADVVIEKPVPEHNSALDSTPADSPATSMQWLVQLFPFFPKKSNIVVMLWPSMILIIIIFLALFTLLSDFGMSPESQAPGAAAGEVSMASPMACFGTMGFGITCLDESGWRSFSEDNSSLGHDVSLDMAVCPDNSVLIAHNPSIGTFDGQNWVKYKPAWGSDTPSAIACDGNGGIWVIHYDWVTYFDGKSWTTTPSFHLATSDDAIDLVKDVAIAPDGQVWVASVHTIATTLDGSEWTVYEPRQRFDRRYFIDTIAVDNQGEVWAAHSSGLLHFDGTNWTTYQHSDFTSVEALTVDDDGNVWVGTFTNGLKLFDGQNWVTYDTQNSGLISNRVRSLAIDAQGRAWVGTDWGLSVFDGLEWQTYQMDNADLADNHIRSLAVIGDGPALPEASDKKNGSLRGQLLNPNQESIANTTIELCAPRSHSLSDRPCKGQPLILQTTIDADGHFLITDIPVGRVALTIKIPHRKWLELKDDYGYSPKRILINAAEETDLSLIIDENGDYFKLK